MAPHLRLVVSNPPAEYSANPRRPGAQGSAGAHESELLLRYVSALDLGRRIPLPDSPWYLVDYDFNGKLYKLIVETTPGRYVEVSLVPQSTLKAVTSAVKQELGVAPKPKKDRNRAHNPITYLVNPLWTIKIYRRGIHAPVLLRTKKAHGQEPFDVLPAIEEYLSKKRWRAEKYRFHPESLVIDVLLTRE